MPICTGTVFIVTLLGKKQRLRGAPAQPGKPAAAPCLCTATHRPEQVIFLLPRARAAAGFVNETISTGHPRTGRYGRLLHPAHPVRTDINTELMILKRLSILHYKNILQAETGFSPKINCFFGNNGMGKTNLLDAIHYLSFCKSLLNTPDSQLIHYENELCVLQGEYDYEGHTEEIFCALKRRQRKQFKRNKKEYDKLSEHIGLLPLVAVSPADVDLIRGGSEERRRFLDVIISQHDKQYLHALIQYNKALVQRNALLKREETDASLYEVLELQMEMYGRTVFGKRTAFVSEFVPIFNDFYRFICQSAEQVGLQYLSQLAGEPDLAAKLARTRERDRVLGYSSSGIHKDELDMKLDDCLIRRVGSQGQNKTYLIALKLAQFDFLHKKGETTPILLLDDIFDKLDALRVEQIIKLVSGSGFGQIFITDTNRKYLDEIVAAVNDDYRLFEVEQGEVKPIGGGNETNE